MINFHILQHKYHYVSCIIKQICKICNKNILSEKYGKTNNLFKMKELKEIDIWKG